MSLLQLSEVEQLNPDSDLDNLSHREIIKLPVDKYSAHEQYEMQGTFGAPAFFRPASLFMNSLLVGVPLCSSTLSQETLARGSCKLGKEQALQLSRSFCRFDFVLYQYNHRSQQLLSSRVLNVAHASITGIEACVEVLKSLLSRDFLQAHSSTCAFKGEWRF